MWAKDLDGRPEPAGDTLGLARHTVEVGQ